MKQLIVLVAMITLGIFIFNLVAGPDDDSIKSNLERVWQNELTIKTVQNISE